VEVESTWVLGVNSRSQVRKNGKIGLNRSYTSSPTLTPIFFIFKKMFQQDDTFCTLFYSLQTALHVSGEAFTHHQQLE
jgi:hypothetical protein